MKKKWQKPELKKQIFVEHEKLMGIGSCAAWEGTQTDCWIIGLTPCDCPSNPLCYFEPSPTSKWNNPA